MRPSFFKALGVVTLFANSFFTLGKLFPRTSSHSYRELIACSVVLLVGIGLIFLRKWAALYFSLPLFCFGIWVALSAIPEDSFPYNLLVMAEGIALMLPLVVTIKVWRQLTWGGRWFF